MAKISMCLVPVIPTIKTFACNCFT